jgi:hypothetical protein
VGVTLLAIWALIVLGVVALIIEFGDGRGGAWLVGVVILAAASLATIGLVLLIWTFQLVAVGGVEVVLVDFTPNFGHEPTLFFATTFAILAIGMAFTAVGQAACWSVIRQRKTEGSPHSAGAAT